MSEAPPTLDQIAARCGELYSLPTVALEVLRLTQNPEVDSGRLKQCIERDPALASKILRVVNSSLFGLSRPVSDLNQALALLGVKPLKLLVLGFSLPDELFTGVAGDLLAGYWRHTLTRAVAAREIAERIWRLPGDEAFIAGLLEDLGQLVLIQELGASYGDFFTRVRAAGVRLTAAERHALGFDHTQLTARLLSSWGLPSLLVEAVAAPADHASLERLSPEARPLGQILHLAEMLSQLLVEARPNVLCELLDAGQRYHNLSAPQIAELVDALEDKVQQLAGVLSLELPEPLSYRDVMAEAHRRLVAAAADAAGDVIRCHHEALNAQVEGLCLLDEVRQLSAAVADYTSHPGERPTAPAARRGPTVVGAASAAATTHTSPPHGPRGAANPPPGLDQPQDVDPGLLGRLEMAVAACRQARRPLSLLVAEIDHYADIALTGGLEQLEATRLEIDACCRAIDHPHAGCFEIGDGRFAVIFLDCDRQQAVRLAGELLAQARLRTGPGAAPLSVSVGAATVALPPRNFPPGDLFNSAARCLSAARMAGGNMLKSIEIY